LKLTLLSRSYCHLCDEMLAAVRPLAAAHGMEVVVIDVDADPQLEAAHGDRVPVLFLGTPEGGRELCHFHVDLPRVSEALAGFAEDSAGRAAVPKTC
jgi:hypothetical protein